jgi:hypothetical protein
MHETLAADERARAERFHFAKDRQRLPEKGMTGGWNAGNEAMIRPVKGCGGTILSPSVYFPF